MLVINYKGNTPQQRFYNFGVQGNDKSNIITFVVGRHQPSVDLLPFACNLKLVGKGSEYKDYINLVGEYDENSDTISFEWLMTLKSTEYRNLEMQLEFIGDNGEIIWQTLIVGLELSDEIIVDKKAIGEKDATLIDQLSARVGELDAKVDELESDVENAKEIIIDNPSDYLNEKGLEKIIRVADRNNNVNKSYLINKVNKPSTLVEMKFDDIGEESGEIISNEMFAELNNFTAIFGDSANDYCENLFVLFYNRSGVITQGVLFSNDESYGSLTIDNGEHSKEIRIVVGKYFEYDENGNKVFDEHSALYYESGNGDGTIDITEEKMEITLSLNDNGHLYFDSDGNNLGFGNTRFILYEINTGEPASIEYKQSKIIESEDVADDLKTTDPTKVLSANQGHELLVKKMPCFKPSTTLKEIYEYYLENKAELGTNYCISFMVMENDITNSCWITIDFTDLDEIGVWGLDNTGRKIPNRYYDYNGIKDSSIISVLEEIETKDLIVGASMTQSDYDNLANKDSETYYFIYEE